MRRILLAAALAMGTTGALAQDQGLVTVITSAEPQTQLMAMVLTMQALQAGTPAEVLLCGPGGDLALLAPPTSATAPQAPQGASPHGLLQKLLAQGAAVQVCALYLPNAELGPDALLDGVTVAAPPEMAARMLAPSTRVWSF